MDTRPSVECSMTDYELSEVDGIGELKERMANAETIEDWSFILNDYLNWGNSKISKNTAIFNMNSATDCPNLGTENCQVPKESCYAYKAEQGYGTHSLAYRRRQEFLWDSLDPETFAKAFLQIVSRKRKPVKAIRFSESGDFRHESDIIRVNRIAELLSDAGILVYSYSASNYLDWSHATDFTVNASNQLSEYGDQNYIAVETESDIPDDGFHCPYDKTDGEIKCGECMACYHPGGEQDTYITIH